MKNNLFFGILCTIATAFVIICAAIALCGDKNAPVITVGSTLTEYMNSYDDKTLLADVTAYDKEDGDVTDSLIVKSIVTVSKGNRVKITYAAKDSSNNVATASRTLKISGKKTGTKETTKKETAGKETTVKETASENNTTEDETTADENETPKPINKTEVDKTGIPAIELKETEFTIKVGGDFNLLNHIAGTYDDKEDVSRRVQVAGDYDVNKPGEYKLEYCVTDSDGNRSEVQIFTLYVER